MHRLWDPLFVFCAWLAWYFQDLRVTLITVAVLCVVDVITGITASKKQGIPFESYRLRISLGKLIAYQLALVLAFITEPVVGIPLVKAFSGYIALIEFQSTIENLEKIFKVKLWAAVKDILAPKAKL